MSNKWITRRNLGGKNPKMPASFQKFKMPVSRMIKKQINRSSETKYHDYDRTTSDAINSTGLTYPLANVPDGTLANERVGEKLRAFEVELRGTIKYLPLTTAVNPTTVRFVLYRDMSQGTQASTITDVLEGGANPTTQQYSWENLNQFQIIKDIRVTLDPLQTRQANIKSIYMKVNRTMLMSFDGAGGGSGGKGRLYLGCISDESTIAVSPHFNFCSRLKFKDS